MAQPAPQTDGGKQRRRTVTSPRAIFAEWAAPYLDTQDELRLPELKLLAVDHFLEDREYLRAFLTQEFGPWLYEIAQRRVAQTRGLILFGSTIVSREQFIKVVRQQARKFEIWREYTSSGHLRLMDMSQTELFEAADIRERRAHSELRIAQFLRRVGQELRPGEVVRQHFSASQLARLEAELQGVEEVVDGEEPGGEMTDPDAPSAN